nr:LacI family DNA-binding transcriptional regulator [Allostreptomyces psammosilenae]
MNRNARPTLEAVAAHAGVSRATVSRVVNGGNGVRESVRLRVEQAVKDLGYVPNQAARTLVTRRHDAVAVIIGEPERAVFSDPFFPVMLRGISQELTLADKQLLLMLVERTDDYDRMDRYLAGGHVDGALLLSLHENDPLPAVVQRTGIPLVYGGRPFWPGGDAQLHVDSDNRGGARLAVEYLLQQGRERIGVITGPLGLSAAQDRLEGYRDALPGGDPALIVEGDFTQGGGERAMELLLEQEPDAVFVCSDYMAAGALRVLREHRLRTPEDVAVVGFDDAPSIAPWTEPPLTTVRQDVEEMGRLMTRLLMRRLSGGDQHLDSILLPTELVIRQSA